ncbi:MAG: hypothetical protein AAFO02_20135, partial [Bacteroidota bacterium]
TDYPIRTDEYFSLSWWLLNCQDYEGAIWAGEAYVAGGGKEVCALSNLAMGYLYNGQEEKAMAIYQPNLGVEGGRDRTGREVFLQDLEVTNQLEVKDPEVVARVRAFLEDQ